MATRYYIALPEPDAARGNDPELAFSANGADAFAAQLQQALRDDGLFRQWRDRQDDPDAVDPSLGATDPAASVSGSQQHLQIELVATTSLPASILQQRLRLLAGNHWQIRDIRAA